MFIVKLIKAILIIFVFLAAFFPIYINVSLFALTNEEIEQKVLMLEQAMEAAAEDPDNPELLYKKAVAMLETLGPPFSLRTATTTLLRAIELDPDNREYKDYLCQVYDYCWKHADYTVDEKDLKKLAPVEIEIKNELQAIKDRVKAIVDAHRAGPVELIYHDYWEIQDPEGEHEVESKYLGEKVRIKRTRSTRTVTSPPKYPFPLEVGMKWGESADFKRDDNMYCWYVEAIEDVKVPAGTFRCYRIVNRTCPDDTIEWYSPDVGVVKIEYRHHGTITNYTSELKTRRASHE